MSIDNLLIFVSNTAFQIAAAKKKKYVRAARLPCTVENFPNLFTLIRTSGLPLILIDRGGCKQTPYGMEYSEYRYL